MKNSNRVPDEPWTFKGHPVLSLTDTPEGAYGFIYRITNTKTGKFYIGKKCLYSFHKEVIKVPGKGKRLKKQVNIQSSESNWTKYFGSNKVLLDEIKQIGKKSFVREILYFVNSKKLLTYFETKEQFKAGVLEPGVDSYCDNILGKFYRKDFE